MRSVRAHVLISGHVQGVYFRDSTRRLATQLGVTGWVRNLPDGRVEALFEGEEPAVRRIVEWCSEGPPGAWVNHVETAWGEPTGEFDRFAIGRVMSDE